MRLLLCTFLLALAACSAMPKVKDPGRTTSVESKDGGTTTTTESDQAVFNKTVLDLLSRPLVKLTCPATGCVMSSFEVGMPLSGQVTELLAKPKEPTPELHPAAQAIRELIQPVKDVVLAGLPAFITGRVAIAGFQSMERTATGLASLIQAPAGTSVAITGSNGVGVLGGSGAYSTSDRHDTTTTTSTVTTDSSNRWAIDILCNFTTTTGSPPAYCSAPR